MSKLLLAILGIGGAVCATAIVVKAVKGKKYATVDGEPKEEDPSVMDRIKHAAEEKVISILQWSVDHPELTKAALMAVDVVPVIIGAGCDIYQARSIDKINKRMDSLESDVINNNGLYSDGYNMANYEMRTKLKMSAQTGEPITFKNTSTGLVEAFVAKEVIA